MATEVIAEKRASHIAIADKPDLCKVGNSVCAFISFATLDQAKDLRGNPLPTQGQGDPVFHMGSYVPSSQGNAGTGIRSGGHSGPFNPEEHSETVKSQGEYQVHDGHTGQINCASPGSTNGNTTAVVHCGSTGGGEVDVCISKLKLQLENLRQKIKAEWNESGRGFIWNAARGAGSGVKDTGGGMVDGVVSSAKSAWDGAGYVLQHPLDSLGSAAESVKGAAVGAWDGAGQVWDVGTALYDGDLTVDDIIDGIEDVLMDSLGAAACSVADELQKMLSQPDGGAHGLGYLVGQLATYAAVAVATDGIGTAAEGAASTALASERGAALIAKANELTMGKGESIAKFLERLKKRRLRRREEPGPNPVKKHGGSSNDGRPEVPGCKVICALVGHPINPLYGCKLLAGPEDLDFTLPGVPAIEWQRSYFSDISNVGPFGQGWTLPYDLFIERGVDGYTLIDAQGRRVPLPRPVPGQPRWVAGEDLLFGSLRDGSLLLVDSDGQRQTFSVVDDSRWRLTSIADGYRNTLLLHWDQAGLLAAVSSDAQHRVELEYADTEGGRRVVGVYEIPGRAQRRLLVSYRYTPQGDLHQVYDRSGNLVREFEWRNHVMVMHRQPGGIESRYEYDVYAANGKVSRNWDSLGREWRLIYRDGETRVVDNLRRSTRFRFDSARRLTGTVDAEGREARYELDRDGNVLRSIDEAGRVTRYARNGNGMPILVTQPDGAQTFLEYHARFPWLPVAVTDAEGHTTTLEYDDRGGLVAEVNALGGRTEYRRDERGRVAEIVDARGGLKRLRYAADGQPVSHIDCSGSETRYAYDDGRLSAIVDAMGMATRYAYDRSGRVTRIDHPDGTNEFFAYDQLGRLIAHSDENAAITRYHLAPDGLPLARVDALGHTLQYRYDAVRRLSALINENGASHTFGYDVTDQLIREQGFDGTLTRYRYDAVGQLVEKEEPGQPHAAVTDGLDLIRTRFERDEAGRIVEMSAGHARTRVHQRTRYAYNGLGRLISAVNAAGALAFSYDPLGRLIEETSRVGGDLQRLQHGYDELGNRIRTVLPDGQSINRLYYGSGHLHQINLDGDVVTDIERDALHRQVARTQGTLESRYRYDARGRLVAQQARLLTHTAGVPSPAHNQPQRSGIENVAVPVLARHYQYDRTGKPLAIRDARFGSTVYAYDAIGRLLQANEERFAFDPASNILDTASQGTVAVAPARAPRWPTGQGQDDHPFDIPVSMPSNGCAVVMDNRVRVHGDQCYAYDAHGNMVEKRIGADTVMRFAYDPHHRMVSAEVTRRGVTQHYKYYYDALGRRVCKRGQSATTRFVWDGDALLAEDQDNGTRCYIYGEDTFVPLAQVETRAEGGGSHQILHYHTDQVGTPHALTRCNGGIVWQASYRAWGDAVIVESDAPSYHSASDFQPLRFLGQYHDDETGLHYNRHRYYDPNTGRFISKDPIGLAGGFNVYQYGPNPTAWIDPLGLARCPGSVLGRKVYQDDSLIDGSTPLSKMNINQKALNSPSFDKLKGMINNGATNLDLMKSGYAPFGPDGNQLNLHHVLGDEPGPMVELSASTHQKYYKPLHGLIEDGASFRNNPVAARGYDRFRRNYWKKRAENFGC
jgi:RHS repeat-associated protein